MVGIYRIKNKLNKNSYYGSSKNIEKRWKQHKTLLKSKRHHNIYLQRAWEKYGENNFLFEIIELCDEKLLYEIEQKYLDTYPKYNIGLKSCGGDNFSKNPNQDKIKKKISESLKKKFNSMGEDKRKEMFSKSMEKNSNWKGGKSVKYCECGIRIGSDHSFCNKCRPRSGNKNPFYGKKHTIKIKKFLSKKRMGTYNGDQNIPIEINGVLYRSAGEASKKLNIPMTTIRWRVISKNKKFNNYKHKK